MNQSIRQFGPRLLYPCRGATYESHRVLKRPGCYAVGRGFNSTANLTACSEAGVEVECIPQRGGVKKEERQAYTKLRKTSRGELTRASPDRPLVFPPRLWTRGP